MPLIYLDTGVFIQAFETTGPRMHLVRDFLGELEHRRFIASTSELTLAELLAPIKVAGAMTFDERPAIYVPLLDEGDFIT